MLELFFGFDIINENIIVDNINVFMRGKYVKKSGFVGIRCVYESSQFIRMDIIENVVQKVMSVIGDWYIVVEVFLGEDIFRFDGDF